MAWNLKVRKAKGLQKVARVNVFICCWHFAYFVYFACSTFWLMKHFWMLHHLATSIPIYWEVFNMLVSLLDSRQPILQSLPSIYDAFRHNTCFDWLRQVWATFVMETVFQDVKKRTVCNGI